MTESRLIRLTPAAEQVIAAIRAAGGRPLVVGGSVRDALLAAPNGRVIDIDIEVHGAPDEGRLVGSLARLGATARHGAAFEIVSAVVGGERFDVSFADTGGGGARLSEEAEERLVFSRRDFTINALGWDPVTGRLIDHYGGVADLRARVLRRTSDEFARDPLRVLRGMQLAARFGLGIAPETAAFCSALRARYAELPEERVWGEWRKLARQGRSIPSGLRVLEESGWLELFPELAATRGIPQDPRWHAEGDVYTHLGLAADQAASAADRLGLDPEDREISVLAALLHDLGKTTTTTTVEDESGGTRIISHGHAEAGVPLAEQFLGSIGAPRAVQRRILPLVREHMAHAGVGRPSAAAVRRLIRRLAGTGDGPTLAEWARLVDADSAGRGPSSKASPAGPWLEVAEQLGPIPRRGLLTGDHLLAAGMTPGPELGALLREALAAQDDGEFDDEPGALAWLERRSPG